MLIISKITELKQCKKVDLQNLVEELGVDIEAGDKIAIIIQKIESADDFDKQFVLTQVGYIVKDREDRMAAEKQREKGGKEREREGEDKQKEHEFALEELKLTQGSDRRNSTSSSGSERPSKLPQKTFMHRFDPERSDITLFLNFF